MRRGFKAEAERISLAARKTMGLPPAARLDPWEYAESLNIVVLDFDELKLAEKHRSQLVERDEEGWSGLTLKEGERFFVVLNPAHERPRHCNTLMHEVSHIYLKHVPGRVDISVSGLMLLSDYPDDQEQEADWLSAALLLPRDALQQLRYRGVAPEAIATKFEVSTQLVEWRLRMTGVEAQLRNSRQFS